MVGSGDSAGPSAACLEIAHAGTGTAADADAACLEVARAVALDYILPRLKAQGRAGAHRLHAILRWRPASGDDVELARTLADAETLARVVRSGAAAEAQRAAERRTRDAIAAVPRRLPEATARRAVTAAGATARMCYLADVLDAPEHAAAVAERAARLRAGRTGCEPPVPPPVLAGEALAHARNAATVRAAAAALSQSQAELERAVRMLADQLTDGGDPQPDAGSDAERARAALRLRLAAIGRIRHRRAARLADQLLIRAGGDGPSPVPAVWPTEPALLAWMRGLTNAGLYTAEFENTMAAWLGPDPFRLRALPAAPEFLTGIDVTALPAEHVAPFLRRISLTRPAPTADHLSAAALEADRGRISTAARTAELRRWGQPVASGAPLLPEQTRMPHVVHGIWLGKPLPPSSSFWRNYGEGAQRYAGEVDFVFWTDVPRAKFVQALAEPAPPAGQPDPLAYVRRLLGWARRAGIHIVNVFEVFHAGAPMTMHPQFILEMAKQLPRGFASASDQLRVEIVHRLGGAYVDGDNSFGPPRGTAADPEGLPEFFDRLAGSVTGFTINPKPDGNVAGDVVAGPARHPALTLWRESIRVNYFRTQSSLFGGVEVMAQRFTGTLAEYRYLAPHRTGCIHGRVLAMLGIHARDLPSTEPAVSGGRREWSWTPPATGEPVAAVPDGLDGCITTLARCATFLLWQLITREGDLYLAAVDPVIRGLPDPDAAWIGLLAALVTLSAGVGEVTSVTDLRRNDDGRTMQRVNLPPEAELLLDRTAAPEGWLGAPLRRRPVWLLDEHVAPAALRALSDPRPSYLDIIAPLAEAAIDAFGVPIGLWLRPPERARMWRHGGRFAAVPRGHIGVSLGGAPRDAVEDLSLRPEAVAVLLAELSAADRPVLLTVPGGTTDAWRTFAARLEQLLDQPVTLAEPALIRPDHAWAVPSLVPPVSYVSLAAAPSDRATDAPGAMPAAAVTAA